MARKKIEPITSFGEFDKLTVQKSNPLFALWRSSMTLAEFKILDAYLSRINSHDPEHRTVVFTKGELEALLGVTRINKQDLLSRLRGLGRFVDLPTDDKHIQQIALFEEASGYIDDAGIWTVSLTCTSRARKYIFDVDNIGYLRYKLRSVVGIQSRYSYILFLYIEKNRYRKSWEVSVEELRQMLDCTEDYYSEFFRFNQKILQRCHKELHEKTECRYTYTPVKRGKKVVAIRFEVETRAELVDAEPTELPEAPATDNAAEYFRGALPEAYRNSLTPEQILLLVDEIRAKEYHAVMPESLPERERIFKYLRTITFGLTRARNGKVAHPFEYIRKLMEDGQTKAQTAQQQTMSYQSSVPYGASGQYGEAELEAIQRMMSMSTEEFLGLK